MSKTDIDWCDMVWNPVWGCFNNCPYCYARNRIVPRHWRQIYWKERNYRIKNNIGCFAESNLRDFKPQWLESNFVRKFPKKPKRIFVNSMSDIKFWEPSRMVRVLNRIQEYPQHTFIFLTKFPMVYPEPDYYWPDNCLLGLTVEDQTGFKDTQIYELSVFEEEAEKIFLNFEPLQAGIMLPWYFAGGYSVKWVIIGAETGPRVEKIIPKKEWIQGIVDQCRKYKIPVFLKGNLKDIWKDKLIQEYPE